MRTANMHECLAWLRRAGFMCSGDSSCAVCRDVATRSLPDNDATRLAVGRLTGMLDESMFAKFDSWSDVLAYAERGASLWYHAPLDHRPVPVAVIRIFKNRKMRIAGPGLTFTVDAGHTDRFRHKGA